MSLVLLGGGGHASDVLSVIEALQTDITEGEPIYVADDAWNEPERFEDRGELKMVESIEAGALLGPFLVAIGYPKGRRAVHDIAIRLGGEAAEAVVHPNSTVHRSVRLEQGVVVMGQTWISPGARIDAHAHVSYGVTIGHDTQVGAFSSVMPGACIGGNVKIGDGALIGANCTILQGLTIGDGAVVGAGAVVIQDCLPDTTVVGVPATVSSS